METVRDLIKQDLKNDPIESVKIVAPTDLNDPAILRVIVDYGNRQRQTIILKLLHPGNEIPTDK
jgi:hypothetical protein